MEHKNDSQVIIWKNQVLTKKNSPNVFSNYIKVISICVLILFSHFLTGPWMFSPNDHVVSDDYEPMTNSLCDQITL